MNNLIENLKISEIKSLQLYINNENDSSNLM
jgi:hypothetical protein